MKAKRFPGLRGGRNKSGIRPWRALNVCVLLSLAILIQSCATTGKRSGPKFVFFPPAPDEPRLQFLTSFNSDRDMRSGGRDSFMTFVTGKAPTFTPILKPYGGFAGRGKIFVCDTAGGLVLRLDLAAGKIHAMTPSGPGAFKMPLNMTMDADGFMYVADGGREQVLIFDPKENFVDAIGEKGKSKPRDVAVSVDRIFIGDLQSNCVHVLNKKSHELLYDIPRPEEKGDINKRLFQPINIALDSGGRLYVSDFGAYRVQVYDPDGKFIRSIGEYGDNYGEFARPKGVAVDRENRVYVVDAAGQHVQVFDESGRLLMWFGEPSGSSVGLNLPAKVLLDYDNVELFQKYASPDFTVEHLVIVMNQYGDRKVSVFGFGHKK